MTHFDQELALLKEKVLTMASYAEAAVKEAVEALMNRDAQRAARVNAGDEIIDRFELEVDEAAIALLAKAPLASDLRLIAVAMKTSQNLERVGDEATKIAKRARDLSMEPPLKLVVDVSHMADLTLHMLKSALDAFVNQDPTAARALIPHDKEVDALHKEIHKKIADFMMRDSEAIARCLHLMVAVKSLERIADHSKNVAEEVVFLCEAQDIRHTGATRATTA